MRQFVTPREFILYADESTQKGAHYSSFFGGLLISSQMSGPVSSALAAEKQRLNLHNEVKWQKVSQNYLVKYKLLLSRFFEFVQADIIKVRIMFIPNSRIPQRLSKHHRANKYNLLYYQFIKHAFDFRYCDLGPGKISLQIRLDDLPGTPQQKRVFFDFLYGLNNTSMEFLAERGARIYIPEDGIGEIDSRDNDLLQCLDVVLGAMQFRLNRGYAVINPETGKRASKTIAKDELSTHILNLVRDIIPNFQPEVSTWVSPELRWRLSYRHWSFKPRNR